MKEDELPTNIERNTDYFFLEMIHFFRTIFIFLKKIKTHDLWLVSESIQVSSFKFLA